MIGSPTPARVVAALVLLTSGVCAGGGFPFREPIRPVRPFQVMVHRGAARQAPENTRPALTRCIEDGFEWVEVDLRLTRDGHHVLAHDDELTDGQRKLSVVRSTLTELRELDLGTDFAMRFRGERILSLEEALTLARDRCNLYLDAKAVDPARLVRTILDHGSESQVVIYGAPELLQRLHAAAPGRIALMAKWRPGQEIGPWVQSNHLAAVEVDADVITPEVSQVFRTLGIKVQSKNLGRWDAPEFWDRAISAGVDWVQTDFPEELLAHAIWRRWPRRPVRVALHRGAGRYAPENTIPAFEKAIRLGADYVEGDVRTTKDGHFYILHNRTLEATTDGRGAMEDLAAGEVARLSAGVNFGRRYADVRLPTLDEFLAVAAGRVEVYFDAKAIAPEAVVAAVRRHGMVERTVVYQSKEYLARLRQLEPRLRRLPPLASLDQLESLVRDVQPFGVDADWEALSRELVARCHAVGVQVFSDALGRHERVEDYLQAMEWGIDVIQTDHPARLYRAMELRLASQP